MEQALIFCRTNFDCDNLERFLNTLGGWRAEGQICSFWDRLPSSLGAQQPGAIPQHAGWVALVLFRGFSGGGNVLFFAVGAAASVVRFLNIG